MAGKDRMPAIALMLGGAHKEPDGDEPEDDAGEAKEYDEADKATATELMEAMKGDDPEALLRALSAAVKVC